MKKNKEEVEVLNVPPSGTPSDFNEKERISPSKIIRMGLATMHNEMKRIVQSSKQSGLTGMEALVLKEYIKTATDVQKKLPHITIGWETEDLNQVSDEEISKMMLEAAQALKIDINDITVQRGRRPAKVIDYES